MERSGALETACATNTMPSTPGRYGKLRATSYRFLRRNAETRSKERLSRRGAAAWQPVHPLISFLQILRRSSRQPGNIYAPRTAGLRQYPHSEDLENPPVSSRRSRLQGAFRGCRSRGCACPGCKGVRHTVQVEGDAPVFRRRVLSAHGFNLARETHNSNRPPGNPLAEAQTQKNRR